MKKIYLLSALLLYFFMMGSDVYSQTVTTTIYATGTTGSYKTGSVNSSGTKNDGNMTTINTTTNRGWAVFDLSVIPPASVISSATLTFTTYSSTLSSATNNIYGFTGNPATMSGTALYAACASGSSFNPSSWSASGPQVKVLNTAGIAFLNANVANANTVIGFVRGSTNAYNIYGYPAPTADMPQLEITYIPGTPCAGQPTAGTVNAPSSQVCPFTPFTVSLNGMTAAGGITIQWQSRAGTSGPWTNISGANNSSESFTATANIQYRAYVVCTNSGLSDTTQPASVSVASPFAGGTYTIDAGAPASATNFQSFTDAVSALDCGIAGPVVFDVVANSGPYNEQVTINEIANASAVNTVTFNGNGETLTYSSSNSNERAGIKLDGADHITINDLVVEPTGTYGFGIQLINDADSNTINGCTVENSLTSTSSGLAGIVVSGSHTSATTSGSDCDGITISNNMIIGGYYGITINNNSGSNLGTNNKIINNIIEDIRYYGIRVYANDGVVIADNDISRPTRSSVATLYGIYLNTYNKDAMVTRNWVHDPMGGATTSTSSNYGIYITGADATSSAPNIIKNNIISFESGNGTQYALYNSSSNYAKYYHNTISLENTASTSGATRGLYQTSSASGIEFKNNIISITRGGSTAKYGIYKNTSSTNIDADNNVFHIASANSSTNNVGYQSGAKTTLSSWQSATGDDANSVSANPQFASPSTGNYKPTNNAIANLGQGLTDVNYDILGYPRSSSAPDPGAYEMVAPCDTPSGLTVLNLIYTSADLTWSPVAGAAGYEYAIGTNPTPPLSGTAITTTNYNASPLNSNTTYYFHLRTECSPGAFSPWKTISFHTPVIPPCIPTIPSVSNVTMNSADINWTSISGANNYEYEVSTSPTPPVSGTATTATSYNATGLSSGTIYYVHVRSDCGIDGFSSWVTETFNTLFPPCLPPTPNISNITVGGADIDWPPIGTAVEYEYAITISSTPPASGGITTTITNHTVGGLYDDQQYYLHIRTDCGLGGVSPWGTTPFTTKAYCIAPTAIISNITQSRADINWNAMSGASGGYEYAVSTSITPPASGAATTGLNYNADQLNPGTQYYIHLRSVCDNNEMSNWSTSGFQTKYPTNVNTVNSVTGIDVYPNPVTDRINVQVNGAIVDNATIIISDVTGKVVKSVEVKTNKTSIDMSDLSGGVYMLRYSDDTYTGVARIVKE